MLKIIGCLILLIINLYSVLGQVSTDDLIQKLEKEEQDIITRQLALDSELEGLRLQKIREDLKKIGLPKVKKGYDDELVEHGAMILSYNEKYEQANWVAHIVVPAVNKGNLSRTNDFRVDSLVKTGSADKADYWYSGFDRGHLAPSADFRWSPRAISESYFYSNMAPQRPELNRESWANVEGFVRRHVWLKNKQLYVITGPVFDDNMATITQGANVVAIPKHFYKVVLDLNEKKGIAFVMPNEACPKPMISYAVSIDEVEKMTGLDFFSTLDDALENEIEASFNFGKWEGVKEDEIPTQEPLKMNERPKNTLNSVEADLFIDQKACVCGMVVSTRKTNGGSVFFNFDAKFPDHSFSGSIWQSNLMNFSYEPEIELLGKKICITGKVTDYKGKPTMTVENEKKIMYIDDTGEEMPR